VFLFIFRFLMYNLLMVKGTELYPLLKAYSKKNKSPYIEIDTFLEYLEKYASRKAQEQAEWKKWIGNKSVQFWSELSALVEDDKCMLVEDDSGGRVYMPLYYADLLREIYNDPDKICDMPFPSEESLGVTIPDNQLKIINLKADMRKFLDSPDDSQPPDEVQKSDAAQIIKLIFPEGCGSALLLPAMIPRKLMEVVMLKLRHYLGARGNKEFALHKLTPQFPGTEQYLRDTLDQVIVRPNECVNSLERAGDFTFLFWNHFCYLVKNDIKKRDETLSEDMAAIQSAHIIETFNGFYRAREVKSREREIAFRNLELRMAKLPGFFTRDEIAKFTTDKGEPLLGMYSAHELDNYIKKMTTESKDNMLPEWLVLNGKEGIQWYIKKDKYLSVCVKQLIDTRPLVKKELARRWKKLLKTFQKEAAMEKDSEFENLLGSYTTTFNAPLAAMLRDQKLQWIFDEMGSAPGGIPPALRIFKADRLLPLSTLYSIRRRDMLADAKMLLPFWYTFPVISSIAAFFHRLTQNRNKKPDSESSEIEETPEAGTNAIHDLRGIAETIKSELIPQGQTLEAYMDELENRWNRLIGEQARQNLTQDVQSLVRDHARKMIKVHKTKKISRESIHESVHRIIDGTSALRGLSNQDSLCLYMELYMAQLLSNIK